MSEKKVEEENKKTNIEFKIKIGLNQNSQVEFIINDQIDIESNIDAILYYMDKINTISNLSSLRVKYANLFNVSLEKVDFYFDINKWSEWEKAALILFTRYPFATNRDYVWKHDISPKNLNTHLVQKVEFLKKFKNNQIGLTELGFEYILNKLEIENKIISETKETNLANKK